MTVPTAGLSQPGATARPARTRPATTPTAKAGTAKARAAGADWPLTGLILLAIGVVAAGLGTILTDMAWWFVMMAMAAIVLAAASFTRMVTRHAVWPPAVALAVTLVALTLFFAPATGILGLIPTQATFEAFADLQEAGAVSIAGQAVPADAVTGIVFFLCIGVAAIAIAMDACVFILRSPAIAGLPLLQLLLVPSLVDPELSNPAVFAVGALAYVAILLRGSRRIPRTTASMVAAGAVALALAIPLALPPVEPPAQAAGNGSSLSTGINPIITLGDDLRRGAPSLALTYTTSSEDGLYLRLTALDEFTGESWQPTDAEFPLRNDVDAIGAPAGLGTEVPVTTETTEITVANIQSRWLPAPYAPRSIEGLEGSWAWEADALSIRSSRGSSARNQDYTVESLQIAPSVEQLTAAGNTTPAGFDRYLAIPPELPPVVAETAASVTAGLGTHYEQALALQSYFTSPEFVYSEDAPVDAGYDGSGASVLGAFLEAKSGYCVHYSSAMASMARTLGIPARVAVGFTPGERRSLGEEGVEYRVSTYNLHAWPELYFDGIGWVRFEPTPSRGFAPAFAPLTEDDPATPDVDESEPAPVTSPAPVPEPSGTAAVPDGDEFDDESDAGTAAAPASVPPWLSIFGALIALVLLTPAILRALRRASRLRAANDGEALPAWLELADTAEDLGLRLDANATPRQFALDLAELLGEALDDEARAALGRILTAVETQSFAVDPIEPDTDDVQLVIRGMRRRAGVGATVRATILPRSLFAAWLPSPSPAPAPSV